MRERVFSFGPSNGIVGILSEPDPSVARTNAPVVIASNVGMNHRVGPYRAYVELARALAARGYPMLRFDLSGLGDSTPRRDNSDAFARAVRDVEDAMSALSERKGATRFVQLGFCSGVDSAHVVSVKDPRVAGALFVEGYSFRTPRFYLRRYLVRTQSPRFWRIYLRRKLAPLLPRGDGARVAGDAVEIYTRLYPDRSALAKDYQALLARDVRMLFVFVGGSGADHAHNYEAQFYDNFPALRRESRVELAYYPHAGHIFNYVGDRAELVARIARWLEKQFP
ncbi:MAG: alpha/beta fold hydrolase [Polyangiales bacterium]